MRKLALKEKFQNEALRSSQKALETKLREERARTGGLAAEIESLMAELLRSKRRVISWDQYDAAYQVWKGYKKKYIDRHEALKIIGDKYGVRSFFLLYPFYKIIKPFWKFKTFLIPKKKPFMPITHRKYQKYAKEAINLGGHKVLKTDTWNETQLDLPIKADAYLELDNYRVHRALSSGYNVIQGDIRQIPFPDGEFGTVIDLSTIDHIPDYEKAIQEYHRVLKNDGTALIVAWLSTWRPWPTEEKWGGKQYWFKAGEFRDTLGKYFEIIRASCKSPSTSFRRRPESRFFKIFWTPDVTGVTVSLSFARGSSESKISRNTRETNSSLVFSSRRNENTLH